MCVSDDDVDRISDRVIGKLLAQVVDALDELGVLGIVPLGAVTGLMGPPIGGTLAGLVEGILGCIPEWFGNTEDNDK